MAAVAVKACIAIRVVVGPKVLWTGGKLYDASVTVKEIVDAALAKAAERTQGGIFFVSVQSFQSEQAMARRGTELDSDDLNDLQVAHLRDSFGRWVLIHAAFDEAAASPATALPSGLQRVMDTQQLSEQRSVKPSNLVCGLQQGSSIIQVIHLTAIAVIYSYTICITLNISPNIYISPYIY